jgi:hypothetical protein
MIGKLAMPKSFLAFLAFLAKWAGTWYTFDVAFVEYSYKKGCKLF